MPREPSRSTKALPSPPALLQGVYKGATYTLFLQPGAPTSGLRFVVYDVTAKSPDVKLDQHMFMIEPTSDALHVTEVFQLSNAGKTTLLDPEKGSIQFFMPSDAQGANVGIDAPGGMPIKRPPEKTKQAGVFKESYPVKPGDATTYEVTYSLPPGAETRGQALWRCPRDHGQRPRRDAVGGQTPDARAGSQTARPHLSRCLPALLERSFELSITGTGVIRTDAADSGGGQEQQGDTGQPEATAGPARVYDRLYWVLGLAFGILAVGGTLLYRRGVA